MKIGKTNNFNNIGFIKLKGEDWLQKQRLAGKVLAKIMNDIEVLIKSKTNMTLLDINDFAENEILKNNCTPTFKGYKGFPNAICISKNRQLVHGVAKPGDKLEEGDVITFDFGVTFENAIADSATTMIYGTPKCKDHEKLVQATKACLQAAIDSIKIGSQLGVIGNAIYKTARMNGFNVITSYGGHGLCWGKAHAPPFVANKAEINEGIRIVPGMSIAIEPLLVPANCSINSKILDDGWTVVTDDVSAHEEHSLFVHEDHVEIITKRY